MARRQAYRPRPDHSRLLPRRTQAAVVGRERIDRRERGEWRDVRRAAGDPVRARREPPIHDSRARIAYFLIPAFYRHEVYSPYEFMGRRLGPGVVRGSSVIFLIGVVLGQGARLFLAAIVLDAITSIGAGPGII